MKSFKQPHPPSSEVSASTNKFLDEMSQIFALDSMQSKTQASEHPESSKALKTTLPHRSLVATNLEESPSRGPSRNIQQDSVTEDKTRRHSSSLSTKQDGELSLPAGVATPGICKHGSTLSNEIHPNNMVGQAKDMNDRRLDVDAWRKRAKRLQIAALLGGEPFDHMPLDLSSTAIRLLEVMPGRGANDRIRCKIRHATTVDDYTCLSYEWGSQDEMHHISINGRLFKVGDNLWQFLKLASCERARKSNLGMPKVMPDEHGRPMFDFESATRSLWIDALCIDQENIRERNHKVRQMGEIYGKARQVFSWLGYNTRHSTPLFERMRVRYSEQPACLVERLSSSIEWFDTNNYWNRAWITQEIVLAQYVYIIAGRDAVDLADVHYHLNEPPSELRLIQRDLWQTLINMRIQPISQTVVEETLLRNFALFREKNCRDIRDKVYSLLSMSQDTGRIKVDYEMPVIDLALSMMRSHITQFCLCHASLILSTFKLQQTRSNRYFISVRGVKFRSHETECKFCGASIDLGELLEGKMAGQYASPETRRYLACLCCKHRKGARPLVADFGHLLVVRISWRKAKVFHITRDVDGVRRVKRVNGIFPQKALSLTTRPKRSLGRLDYQRLPEALPLAHITLSGLCNLIHHELEDSQNNDAESPRRAQTDETCHGLTRIDRIMSSRHGWFFDEENPRTRGVSMTEGTSSSDSSYFIQGSDFARAGVESETGLDDLSDVSEISESDRDFATQTIFDSGTESEDDSDAELSNHDRVAVDLDENSDSAGNVSFEDDPEAEEGSDNAEKNNEENGSMFVARYDLTNNNELHTQHTTHEIAEHESGYFHPSLKELEQMRALEEKNRAIEQWMDFADDGGGDVDLASRTRLTTFDQEQADAATFCEPGSSEYDDAVGNYDIEYYEELLQDLKGP